MKLKQLLCPAVKEWCLANEHLPDDILLKEFSEWAINNKDVINESVKNNLERINECIERGKSRAQILLENSEDIDWGDGEFDLDYFKDYLRIVGYANIKCGYINRPSGVEIVTQNRKTILNIGGMSFEKEACYTATLINNECIQFTKSGTGTNCSNYNFIIPK